MERAKTYRFAAVVLAGLLFAACGDDSGESEGPAPATAEAIDGTKLKRITLTPEAADRIDLQMGAVEKGTGSGTQVPYAALLYDAEGATWVFTKTADLTFERAPITVDRIEGDVAYLTESPPEGTEVATIGATELYGVEIGLGV